VTLYRRAPRKLGDALGPLRASLAPTTVLADVQGVWSDAVGPVIAAEARPISASGGVLTVACDTASWAQELNLMSTAIVEKLNAHLSRGEITRLKCVTGR
jgi:predicted nucleic acid-binding Zn ribbon protein